MIGILGSGFGLYGYLPALINLKPNQLIVLPERARIFFDQRLELQQFSLNIYWVADEHALLEVVEGIVLALRPVDQAKWIIQSLEQPNIKFLLLEKPLAPSPKEALTIFNHLMAANKTFKIGYVFRFTQWAKLLMDSLRYKDIQCISLHWSFLAHHYQHQLNNWKRCHTAGGGAIRFYGIHLIAILAEAGYSEATSSQIVSSKPDEIEKWSAVFRKAGLPDIQIQLDSTNPDESRFSIVQYADSNKSTIIINQKDPFDEANQPHNRDDMIDQRVYLLKQLCGSIGEKNLHEYEWYNKTIKLWQQVESITQHMQSLA